MMQHILLSWFLVWCDNRSPSFNLSIFGLRTRVFALISRSSDESVILEFAKCRFTSSRFAIMRGCWWDVEECFAPPLSRLMMVWECPKFLSVCCCKILQALERGLLILISKLMKTSQNCGKFIPTVIFEKLARRAAKETRWRRVLRTTSLSLRLKLGKAGTEAKKHGEDWNLKARCSL